MGGKLAVFALAFVFSSLGLKAQDNFSLSLDDYTYTGSNGCSSFGACDRNWSTMTDNSGLQSSGWQFNGNSWMVGFTPGQLQSLGPSFADQFNSIQTRIQQAFQNAISATQAAVNEENIGEALKIGTHISVEAALEHLDVPFAEFGFGPASLGLEMAPKVGTQFGQPIIIDPATEFPLSARVGSASPSSSLGDTGPFTSVDPGSVTIVDPPFTGDPSTIIDLSSSVGQGGVTIIDPPFTGDPSTIIDLNTDADAQQMLFRAKQSHATLISEQQQLQGQASQYQNQSQQALQQSTNIVEGATSRAFSNMAATISQRNVLSANSASTGNAWQSFASALNGLSKVGQSLQPTKRSTVPATQPKVPGPRGCVGQSSEEIAACQMAWFLVSHGLSPAAPEQSWMLNTPATQSTTSPLTLGPTGVTCQTDAKGRTLCYGTLPSWMK